MTVKEAVTELYSELDAKLADIPTAYRDTLLTGSADAYKLELSWHDVEHELTLHFKGHERGYLLHTPVGKRYWFEDAAYDLGGWTRPDRTPIASGGELADLILQDFLQHLRR